MNTIQKYTTINSPMFANTSPPTIITVINIHKYTVQLVTFCLCYYMYLARA